VVLVYKIYYIIWISRNFSQDLIVLFFFFFDNYNFYNYHWLKNISILIQKHIWMTIGLLRPSILFITKGLRWQGITHKSCETFPNFDAFETIAETTVLIFKPSFLGLLSDILQPTNSLPLRKNDKFPREARLPHNRYSYVHLLYTENNRIR